MPHRTHRRRTTTTAVVVAGTLLGGGLAAVSTAAPAMADVPIGEAYVSDLPWLNETNGWGPIERDASNGESAAGDGKPLTIGGVVYDKGIGMHATGALSVELGANCTAFSAMVGLDDEVTRGVGTVQFQVFGDGTLLGETGVVTGNDAAVELTADVTGIEVLRLVANESTNGKNYDHADWGDAKVACDDEVPEEPVVVELGDRRPRGSPSTASCGSTPTAGRARRGRRRTRCSRRRAWACGAATATPPRPDVRGTHDRRVSDAYAMITGKRSGAPTPPGVGVHVRERRGARLDRRARVPRRRRLPLPARGRRGAPGRRRVGRVGAAADGPAWMQRSYAVNYEAEWMTTSATAANGTGSVGYPALFQQGEHYVLLTEADLHGDYSGSHLAHAAGALRTASTCSRAPRRRDGDLSTPWRVAIVGELDGVVESTLVDDLATPDAWNRTPLDQARPVELELADRLEQPERRGAPAGLRRPRRRATAGSTCCSTRAGTRAGCRARSATPTRRASTSSRGSTAATCARRSSATSGCRARGRGASAASRSTSWTPTRRRSPVVRRGRWPNARGTSLMINFHGAVAARPACSARGRTS